jgi:serpin B
VRQKTNKKIDNLLPPGDVDGNTRLVLANATYFKGEWAFPFSPKSTKLGDFANPDFPALKIPLMHRTLKVNYFESEEIQLAEFLYKGDDVSMVVILPKKGQGLDEIEKSLEQKVFANWLSAARPAYLEVALPKFTLTQSLGLEKDLRALGTNDAFGLTADFSGMTDSVALHVGRIRHGGCIRVDEMGSEAAGATGVEMPMTNPTTSIPFRAQRPFCFALVHKSTNSIVFLGRLFDPRN